MNGILQQGSNKAGRMRFPSILVTPSPATYSKIDQTDHEEQPTSRSRPGLIPILSGIATITILTFYALYRIMLNSPPPTTATTPSTAASQTTTPLFFFFDQHQQSPTNSPTATETISYPCGTTVASARSAGCLFDPLTVYWLPAHCSFSYADDFLSAPHLASDSNTNHNHNHSSSPSSPTTTTAAAYTSSSSNPSPHSHLNPHSPHQNTSSFPPPPPSWQYYLDHPPTLPAPDLSTLEIGTKYYTTAGEHLTHCAYMLVRLAHLASTGEAAKMDRMTGHFEHSRHCALMLLDAARASEEWGVVNSWGEVRSGDC